MIQLYVEGEQVDLYGDETIEISMVTRSYLSFGQSNANFTNSFTVPASDNNNRIFNHWFLPDNQISIDFRQRVQATIEIDGTPFQQGYVLMEEGAFSGEQIDSYSMTFYSSDLIVFKALEGITLKDLDWSDRDGAKTEFNVRTGLTGNGNVSPVIYPLVQQFFTRQAYGQPGAGTQGKWSETDLQGTSGTSAHWQELHPAVQLKYVWERIEVYLAPFNISFTSDYIDNDASVERLYMYLPYEFQDEGDTGGDTRVVSFDDFTPAAGYDSSVVPNLSQGVISIDAVGLGVARSCQVSYNFSYGTGTYIVQAYSSTNGTSGWVGFGGARVLVGPGSSLETWDFTNSTNPTFADAGYMQVRVYTNDGASFGGSTYSIDGNQTNSGGAWDIPVGSGNISDFSLVDPNSDFKIRIPEMTVNDFITSFMKLFNMVVWSDDGLTYHFEPFDVFRSGGGTYDLTPYTDISKATRRTPVVPSVLAWNYDESETILQTGFKRINGRQYGDIYEATSGRGEQRIEETKFTLPLWEFVYGKYLMFHCYDKDYTQVRDEAPIFYYSGDATLADGDEIDFAGFAAPISTYKVCNAFYPYGGPYTHSLTFGDEIDPLTETAVNVSLYESYYSTYWRTLLDSQARTFHYSSYVPTAWFNLSEPNRADRLTPASTIQIGDRQFLIDRFNVDLITGKADFFLVNIVPDFVGVIPPPTDNTPPNIGTLSVDCDTGVLTWTAATDNVGVLEYRVFRNGIEVFQTPGLTWTDPIGPTLYDKNYYIKAVDAALNVSNKSNTVVCDGTGFDYGLNFEL